jgi:hypothetical protein
LKKLLLFLLAVAAVVVAWEILRKTEPKVDFEGMNRQTLVVASDGHPVRQPPFFR